MKPYCLLGIARLARAIKFSRSPGGARRFSYAKFFRDSKKIFCDFSVGMELENEKSENVNDNKNKGSKMLMSLQQRKRGMPYNPLLTRLVRSRELGIGLVFFLRLYGPRLRLGP